MGGKNPVPRHHINDFINRGIAAVVAISLDIMKTVCNLRIIPQKLLGFALAVSQVDKHLRIQIAADDFLQIAVVLMAVGYDNNSHGA